MRKVEQKIDVVRKPDRPQPLIEDRIREGWEYLGAAPLGSEAEGNQTHTGWMLVFERQMMPSWSDLQERIENGQIRLESKADKNFPMLKVYDVFNNQGEILGTVGKDERPTGWWYSRTGQVGGFTPGAQSLADAVDRLENPRSPK
jgi:hypothetical protein